MTLSMAGPLENPRGSGAFADSLCKSTGGNDSKKMKLFEVQIKRGGPLVQNVSLPKATPVFALELQFNTFGLESLQ